MVVAVRLPRHVHARVDDVPPREEGGARRAAHGLDVVVGKEHPLARERVNRGRRDLGRAVHGHVVETKVVRNDENNVRRSGSRSSDGRRPYQEEKGSHGKLQRQLPVLEALPCEGQVVPRSLTP